MVCSRAGLLGVAADPAAADTRVERQSVPLTSTSSTRTVTLAQFDPAAGTLEQVMVTVTVEGSTEVEVTNLTPAAKETTVTLEATASADRSRSPRTGQTTLTESDSTKLDPDDPSNFVLDGSADETDGDRRSRRAGPRSSARDGDLRRHRRLGVDVQDRRPGVAVGAMTPAPRSPSNTTSPPPHSSTTTSTTTHHDHLSTTTTTTGPERPAGGGR